MTKVPKMQKIPNPLLIVGRDDQVAYFTMLTPIIKQQGWEEHHLLGSRICKLDKGVVAPFFSHILQQFLR
jgi:hypothetical protein